MRVEILRLLFGLGALALVVFGAAEVISPFTRPILWAFILATATWPAYRRIHVRFGQRENLAALTMTFGVSLLVLVPTGLLGLILINEAEPEWERLKEWASAEEPPLPAWVGSVPLLEEQARDFLDRAADPEIRKEWLRVAGGPAQRVLRVGRDLLGQLASLLLTLFTLFFVYRDGETLFGEVSLFLDRIAGGRGPTLLKAVQGTVKAVIFGWLLTSALLGLVAMLGYWIVGLRAPVLLGTATGVAGMIPFGVGLVWIPVIVGLAVSGAWWQCIFTALWATAAVTVIDNILRPLFISGSAKIPFILVFFGVLGGLLTYGLLGLVLGPVFLGLIRTLWSQARQTLDPDDDGAPV